MHRVIFAVVLLSFAIAWFTALDYRKLVKPDEGRYAEVPREMVATGDWLTPRLNGIKYFEKPPLQYWATATAYELFGPNEWTARLWSALTGFLGVLVAGFTAMRLYGRRAGLLAGLVAASGLLYVAIGHLNTLDMGLTFFMGTSLCAFVLAQRDETQTRERSRWMALSWLAVALAILTKGLVALILPGIAIVAYSLIQRDWRIWRELRPLHGILIIGVVAAPWFIWVSIVNPEFAWFFFVHEHFQRFLTKVHHRYQPWWYFIPILVLGLMPWTVSAVAAIRQSWRAGAQARGFDAGRFLVVWFAAVFLFFSVSDSKLPSYILPMFPAAAVFLGRYLDQAHPRAIAWQLVPMAVLTLVLATVTPYVHVGRSPEVPVEYYETFAVWIQVAGVIASVLTLTALVLLLKGRLVPGIVAVAAGALLLVQIAGNGHNSLNHVTSAYHLAHKINPLLKPGVPFYSVRTYEQTLPYYIHRTVTLVDFTDELAFGLEQQPQLAIPTLEAFERQWQADADAFALMAPETYEVLEKNRLPMQIVASDPRRIIVRKP